MHFENQRGNCLLLHLFSILWRSFMESNSSSLTVTEGKEPRAWAFLSRSTVGTCIDSHIATCSELLCRQDSHSPHPFHKRTRVLAVCLALLWIWGRGATVTSGSCSCGTYVPVGTHRWWSVCGRKQLAQGGRDEGASVDRVVRAGLPRRVPQLFLV